MIRISLGRSVSASSSRRPLPINTGPVAVAFLRMVSQHRQAGTGLGKHTPSLASSSAPVHRHSAMHPGADRGGLALLSRWLRRAASRCIVLLPKLEPADRLKRPDVENERPCQFSLGRLARSSQRSLGKPPFPRAHTQSPEPRPATKTPSSAPPAQPVGFGQQFADLRCRVPS